MTPSPASGAFAAVPVIEIGPLYGPDGPARRAVDAAIGAACRDIGFLVVAGQAAEGRLDAAGWRRLMAVFDRPMAEKMQMARRKYAPGRPNIYRGYFPPMDGVMAYKEGVDLGPDLQPGDPRLALGHPLIEANPWPPEDALPQWRAAAVACYGAMERLGFRLLHAIARFLGLAEDWFDDKFRGGNSTLRLLRYPPRPARSIAGIEDTVFRLHGGARRPVMTGEHSDSGCLTLLQQDAVGGLQALSADGRWIDVPAVAGAVVVNLGDLMQRWTGGLFRATEHRVLGSAGVVRESIPFFFEPAVEAVIAPPPHLATGIEDPIVYGDYLIEKVQRFPEFSDFLRPAAVPA
jgi:isopenicillin N synthase-like dioxygenase